MRIRVLKAQVGLTINTGNFNSARIDLGAEADVDLEIENSGPAHAQLIEALKQRVVAQVPSLKTITKQAGG
jgi:hypothetical protein